jgi:hypothetical protein
MFSPISKTNFIKLIDEYRSIQDDFLQIFGVNDIFSNSKIYEVLIANKLNHILIPGHSGSKDAKDDEGNEYKHKHKSNHSERTVELLIEKNGREDRAESYANLD